MTDQELIEKAKQIKALVLDGDGVFFAGTVLLDPKKGEAYKERSHIDGQGISLLRAIGIQVALVSGEKTGFMEKAGEKLNNLPAVKAGKWPPIGIFTGPQGSDKVTAVAGWLKTIGVSWAQCAGMGDDLADYQFLKKVGLAAAPSQAEPIIKNICHFIAGRKGGQGAIRDLANFILEVRGIDVLTLDLR